jgi:hypothetical protein
LPLRREALAASPLHIIGQRSHRCLRDGHAFTPVQRSVRIIEAGAQFRPRALTLLPQRQGFLYQVFHTLQPACADRMPDEFFLLGRKDYLHATPSWLKFPVRPNSWPLAPPLQREM